ncbi:hypothetical protein JS520_00740 [Candidatus Vidania fulgoroideae]|nr:hypothetical protein JS520_00740 [Candidatus Vidania fulgoroideae]
MSKKAKRGILITPATKIHYSNNTITATNNNYTEYTSVKEAFYLIKINTKIFIKINTTQNKALKGTFHSLIANILQGIKTRFKKTLIIEGLGFSAYQTHNLLQIKIGFTQPRYITLTPNINCQIIATKKIILKSTNNVTLGNLCKRIKSLRKYNAYKNKGIRETCEQPLQKKRTKK